MSVCVCEGERVKIWTSDFSSVGGGGFSNNHIFFLFFFNSFSSVQFSRSVLSDSLRPHESQNARPPCPSATPGVHSDSRPSSQGCHPAISSFVVPFSACPQSLPASVSLPQGASHGGSEKPGKLEVGGASRDSTGLGALEEGLISS